MSIAVLGSINVDFVLRAPRLPVAGETIEGGDFFTAWGGKGANQAVACARLGAPVRMIGRVGDDAFGNMILVSLREEGIDEQLVKVTPGPTGVALIVVDNHSENSIVVVPGANASVGPAALEDLKGILPQTSILMLQLEIPVETVVEAARMASERGIRVILDPAPAGPLSRELMRCIDTLTPNETEASALVGFPVRDLQQAQRAAQILCGRGAKNVIIKMGRKGACWTNGEDSQFWPAFKVKVADSVAAGDSFNGALSAALLDGRPYAEAVRRAMAAAALAVTKQGAQPSLPTRRSVDRFLQESSNHQ